MKSETVLCLFGVISLGVIVAKACDSATSQLVNFSRPTTKPPIDSRESASARGVMWYGKTGAFNKGTSVRGALHLTAGK
jgi:hypothetical protein